MATLPIRGDNGWVIQQILSAGGGAALHRAKASPLLANGSGVSVHHYCLVSVSRKHVTVVAKTPDGEIIDRFKVVRSKSDADGVGNLVFEQKPGKPDVAVPTISYQQALSYLHGEKNKVEETSDNVSTET